MYLCWMSPCQEHGSGSVEPGMTLSAFYGASPFFYGTTNPKEGDEMMSERFKHVLSALAMALLLLFLATPLFASEAELAIPVLSSAQNNLLMIGFLICFGCKIISKYTLFCCANLEQSAKNDSKYLSDLPPDLP